MGPPTAPQTARFSVVAAVLSAGSEKAAAYRLGLAHSTLKHHLANARSKVGATTTAQLVWILGPRLPEPEQTAHGDNDGRRGAGGAEARRVPERGVPQHVIPVGMGHEACDDHLARPAEVVPKARQLRGGDPGIDDERTGRAVDDDRQVPEQLALAAAVAWIGKSFNIPTRSRLRTFLPPAPKTPRSAP
jgi:hypothetical protein